MSYYINLEHRQVAHNIVIINSNIEHIIVALDKHVVAVVELVAAVFVGAAALSSRNRQLNVVGFAHCVVLPHIATRYKRSPHERQDRLLVICGCEDPHLTIIGVETLGADVDRHDVHVVFHRRRVGVQQHVAADIGGR